MRVFTAAIVPALVALAAAYTQPDYSKPPSGNAISTPGLSEQVPEGQPFTITWTPTTQGPISLVLLRGPSTNVQPLETIAENIPNSGSYQWTPSTSLTPDTTHYGLLLVVENTGQYQYSTQFGISAAKVSSGSGSPPSPSPIPNSDSNSNTSSSSSSSSTESAEPTMVRAHTSTSTSSSTETTDAAETTHATETAHATENAHAAKTSPAVPNTAKTSTATSTTTTAHAPVTTSSSTTTNTVIVASTATNPTVPTTLQSTPAAVTPSSTTPSPSPTFVGAAGRNAINLGVVAAGMAAAVMAL